MATKFGNTIRDIAEDIQSNVAPRLADGLVMRLREVAAAIDKDHAETLEAVNDIQKTLNRPDGYLRDCANCDGYVLHDCESPYCQSCAMELVKS